jgi:uncharacterized membrane protein
MTPYGAPLHPILVHFPIVLLLVAVLFGVAGCWPSLHRLRVLELLFLGTGLVVTVLTRETGEQNADAFKKTIEQSSAAQNVFQLHDTLSKGVLITFGLLFLLRLGVGGWKLWQSRQKIAEWRTRPDLLLGLVASQLEAVPAVLMIVYLLGAMVGLGLLFMTGYYGGELVYTYGVGTGA